MPPVNHRSLKTRHLPERPKVVQNGRVLFCVCVLTRVLTCCFCYPSHLDELAHVPDAHDLVSLMTAREPDLRPSAGEVCKHPFFWNEEKRLSFLLEFSDRLEQVRWVCVSRRG